MNMDKQFSYVDDLLLHIKKVELMCSIVKNDVGLDSAEKMMFTYSYSLHDNDKLLTSSLENSIAWRETDQSEYPEYKVRHHKQASHHYTYWTIVGDDETTTLTPMDKISVVEMLCDWFVEDYDSNNEYPSELKYATPMLHPDTLELVTRLYPIVEQHRGQFLKGVARL